MTSFLDAPRERSNLLVSGISGNSQPVYYVSSVARAALLTVPGILAESERHTIRIDSGRIGPA